MFLNETKYDLCGEIKKKQKNLKLILILQVHQPSMSHSRIYSPDNYLAYFSSDQLQGSSLKAYQKKGTIGKYM